MGNHGHAYARLRRALLTGNLTIVDAAARWAARAAHERGLDLERNRRMLALLDVLPLAPDGVELRLRDLLQL